MIVVLSDVPIPIAQHDDAVPPRDRPIPRGAAAHDTPRINLRPAQLAPSRVIRQVERPYGEAAQGVTEEGAGDDEVTADDGASREA